MLLGGILGLLAGALVGSLPQQRLGLPFWIPVLLATGLFQAWGAAWILRQSSDVPKMRTAVPLTGPVFASIACVLSGEPFLAPVVAATGIGLVIAWSAARAA